MKMIISLFVTLKITEFKYLIHREILKQNLEFLVMTMVSLTNLTVLQLIMMVILLSLTIIISEYK